MKISYKINFTGIVQLLIVLTLASGHAQDGGGVEMPNFNSSVELNGISKLPKSPEAEAFERFGNTNVNLYTGTPEINVPLHTFKGRELDIPMVLDYDATGVKVSQTATSAGLGWNLTVGGRISRIASGKPDDLAGGPYDDPGKILLYSNIFDFYNTGQLEEYLSEFMEPAMNGMIDTELDLYSINAVGINDYIVIDLQSEQARTLLNPRTTVVFNKSFSQWEVTTENGTKYSFGYNGKKERTTVMGGDDGVSLMNTYSGESVTSWLLTKIESKNKLDTYEFDYMLYTWSDLLFSSSITSMTHSWKLTCPERWESTPSGYNNNRPYKISQQMPLSIKQNGKYVAKFTYKSREDLSFDAPYQGGNALNEIFLYKYNAPISSGNFETVNPENIFKKIAFVHEYFGTVPSGQPAMYYKRLLLKDLKIYSDNLDGKTYSFDYISPNLVPKITSFAQDFWGLYNQAGNSSLVPATNNFTGAHRNYNHYTALYGTLNKITYPTKGYTEFVYEQNELPHNITYPEHSYNASVPILDFTCYSGFGFCNSITPPPQYFGVHPSMQPFLYFYDLGLPGPDGSDRRFHTDNVMSKLITISAPTESGAFFEFTTEGSGIFLIQRITGCENPTFVTFPDCPYYINNMEDEIIPSFNQCLKPANSLFFTSTTNYSYPADYVAGGFTGVTNGQPHPINLPPGTYQVTCWSGHVFDYLNSPSAIYDDMTIHINKRYPVTDPPYTVYGKDKAEGFRIKEIKNYASQDDASPATTKTYQYSIDFDPEKSSGERITEIPTGLMEYRTMTINCIDMYHHDAGEENVTKTAVVSAVSVNNNPYFGYSSVYEIEKDQNGNINGYTQSKFHIGPTGVKYSDQGPTSFEPIYQNGKIFEKNVFDKDKNIRLSEKTTYGYDDFYNQTSFGYRKSSNTKYAYWNGSGGIQYAWGHSDTVGEFSFPAPSPAPSYFADMEWKSYSLGKYSFDRKNQHFLGQYGYVSQKLTIKYPTTGGEIIQTTDYTYDSEYPNHLLSKQQSTSDGFIKEEYTYDDTNFYGNPEKITDIVTSSNHGELFHKQNVYGNYGVGGNFLSSILTSKGGNPLESRLQFDYNDDKNLTTTRRVTGLTPTSQDHDSYIFGYDNRFPVAKIQGIAYNDINNTLLENIELASEAAINGTTNSAMVAALDALRAEYPLALITTYTYDPVYGITSQTDPRGNTTYYEYDELGRLKAVKDNDGYLLSENFYHYKN